MARFPCGLYSDGSEPDPRFSLANERTFLAWVSVSLALLASGVAIDLLALPIARGLAIAASVVLLAVGLVSPLAAWLQWVRVEKALRHDRPLPSSLLAPIVAVLVTVAGALLLLGVLTAH